MALLLMSLTTGTARLGARPATSAPPPPSRATTWSAGIEYQRDRFDYHFDNPSTVGTPELVPHFYEQRYDADNVWLTGRIRFHAGSRALESEGGVSLAATGVGSDYDTFFQPDGNVIVYGTTAVTDIWSWRAAQYVTLGRWGGVDLRVAYAYRRDRAEFRPSDSTTSQTKPPSFTAVWNDDRETTISEVHEIRVGLQRQTPPHAAWQVRVSADVAPTTLARLTTILPDKYDEPVVAIAKACSVNAALHAARRIGHWRLGLRAVWAAAWGYSSTNHYHRNAFSAGVTVGR